MDEGAAVYWEDVAPGLAREGGAFAFDAAAIKRFAREFDPRPTHLDETAAAASVLRGLSASGAHTFAAWARLYEALTRDWATQVGTRIGDFRLLRPVRPGDVLRLRFSVSSKRPHPLRRDFGLVESRHALLNQDGKPVFELRATMMLARRPAPPAG